MWDMGNRLSKSLVVVLAVLAMLSIVGAVLVSTKVPWSTNQRAARKRAHRLCERALKMAWEEARLDYVASKSSDRHVRENARSYRELELPVKQIEWAASQFCDCQDPIRYRHSRSCRFEELARQAFGARTDLHEEFRKLKVYKEEVKRAGKKWVTPPEMSLSDPRTLDRGVGVGPP